MNFTWILTSAVFFIFGAMTFYIRLSPDVSTYLASPEASGQVLIALFSVFIGVLAIVWAFHAETERIRTIEANTFKRSFAALLYETTSNHAAINKLKSVIKPNQFNFLTLSSEIARSMLGNPLTYKYTGREYGFTLTAYVVNIDLTNKWLSFIWDDFRSDGNISDKNIGDLRRQLDDCMHYLLILQVQSQLYVHAYNVKLGPTLCNAEEILGWLSKKPPTTIDELEKTGKEMQELGAKEIKELRKGLQRAIQD